MSAGWNLMRLWVLMLVHCGMRYKNHYQGSGTSFKYTPEVGGLLTVSNRM